MAVQTVILEPNLLQRRLLIEFLARQPGMSLAGVVSTLEEALALCRSCCPDLVMAGLGPALSHGLQTIREIKDCQPQTLILVLLDMDDEHYREAARQQGATYCVAKTAVARQLGSTLADVRRRSALRPSAPRTEGP
jgi:two-component system response regulator NreC